MNNTTPLRAIRKYCLWCCAGSSNEVKLCPAESECVFWPLRLGKGGKGTRYLKTIREKCLDCCAGSSARVRECKDADCSLYLYRFGKRPSTVEKIRKKRLKRLEGMKNKPFFAPDTHWEGDFSKNSVRMVCLPSEREKVSQRGL